MKKVSSLLAKIVEFSICFIQSCQILGNRGIKNQQGVDYDCVGFWKKRTENMQKFKYCELKYDHCNELSGKKFLLL